MTNYSEEYFKGVNTLGELKELLAKCESAGATDSTPIWIGGYVEFSGNKEHLQDKILISGSNIVTRKDWTPNLYSIILYFDNTTYDIPDPDDGPFI